VNSLTLSPALSAILLKSREAPRDRLTRVLDRGLGWLFRPFNRVFKRGSERYGGLVASIIRRGGLALAVYAGLLGLTLLGFKNVPHGFVPTQDKQYLVAFAQLPDASTLDRTEKVIRRMSDIGLKQPGVDNAVQFPACPSTGSSTRRTPVSPSSRSNPSTSATARTSMGSTSPARSTASSPRFRTPSSRCFRLPQSTGSAR